MGEPIRRFGFGDTALGALGTAFTLLYAIVGVPFGRMADRRARKPIIAAGVFVWSVLTAASGLAQNFWQLFALRLGIGVGEATCSPAASSIIGDLFPPARRSWAISTFMLTTSSGSRAPGGRASPAGDSHPRSVYGFSGVPGLILGGMAADAAFRRRHDGGLLAGVAAIAMAAPVMCMALSRPATDVVAFSMLMGAACMFMYAYYSSVYATIQDVIEPSLRGTAMALYFFAMYMLGGSLGPVGTGLISDYFTVRAAHAAGVIERTTTALEPFRATGLHSAMFLLPILVATLAFVLLAASRTVTPEVNALQAWMRDPAAAPANLN